MGWFNSYDEEYRELFSHLTEEWDMKPEYVRSFLNTYKKSIGKILSKSKKRSSILRESSNPELSLFAIAYVDDLEEYNYTIVVQAYSAYMNDLRRGRHVGTFVEKVIWAILADNLELVESVDRFFAEYIEEEYEKKFPRLFEEVFVDGRTNNFDL